MIGIILTAAITVPPSTAAIHFDRIDVNHYVREDGTVAFDQLIFWRWSRCECRFISFGYVMIQDGRKNGRWIGSDRVPRDDGRRFVLEIKRDDQMWRVTADAMYHTWTRHDPEVADRKRYPDHDREWK